MTRRVLMIGGEPRSLTRFRGRLLQSLVASGCEVHAAAGASDPDVSATLASWGVVFHRYVLERAGANPLADLRTFWSLRSLMRTVHPSSVLAYTAKPVVFGLAAARSAGVGDRHALITGLGNLYSNGQPRGTSGRILDRLYGLSLRGSASVIFQNPDDRAVFSSRGHLGRVATVGVVPGSGIELDTYGVLPLPTGRPTALMISRLVAEKGVLAYCEAARAVRASLPDARFLLAGGFDANPNSLQQSDLQPFLDAGDVEYRGRVADVRPLFAESHVFVLPSTYGEGIPRTILEALASGRAVVTTDAPGCRETVSGNNGILVPPGDPVRLAEAIRAFLTDRAALERAAQRSRQLAERVFDVERVNAQMLALLFGLQRTEPNDA